jgi:para-aminobenzoate synthetase
LTDPDGVTRAVCADARADDVVTRVADAARRAAPRAGGTRVVAIDGRSGAGKTSLAAAVAERLRAPVVSLEDLYGGWDGLEHGIDLLVAAVLEPLAAGATARVPRYDWVAGEWAPPAVLEPPDVLIVEGVGAGARRAAAFESVLAWLEVPAPVRRQRALDRDGPTFAPYWDQWAAQEDLMLARERTPDRADITIRPATTP